MSGNTTDVSFDPFAGPAILAAAPTTGPQREVWTGAATSRGANLAFNESITLRLQGPVDIAALKTSFTDLVARHEALRSTFSNEGMSVLVSEAPVVTPFEDWSNLAAAERSERLAELQVEAVETAFDLEKGPLYRLSLVKLADDEVCAVLTAHHIVCDGFSMGILVKDWATLYRARVSGGASLPAAEKYSDYARSETARSSGPEAKEHEKYWLSQFKGELPVLELPSDRPRPPQRSYESRRIDVLLDAALMSQVKQFGLKQRSSFFTTLLAGFKALLHRLSTAEDVVVGIPTAGQSVGGHGTLVGHCVNMLPVRTQLTSAMPFAELVARVRTGMLDASEHQEYTFGTLLTKLPIARDLSRPPLVSVVFNVESRLTSDSIGFPQLKAGLTNNPRHFETFDVFINAVELSEGLLLECQYSTPLFDESTVRRWLGSFEQLLRGVVAEPTATVGMLRIVSPADTEQLATWAKASAAQLPEQHTVHQLIAAQVGRTPAAIACQYELQRLSYADLNRKANQLARKLRSLGVKRGGLVGLSVERSPSMLVGLLGILKAGAAYVPLDPGYPKDRLTFMVEDSAMQVLVTEDKPRAELNLDAKHVISIDGDAVSLAGEDGDELSPSDADAQPTDPAYVIYTSGSTGKPKGVLVHHLAAVNLLNSVKRRPGMTERDGVLAVTTLSFDIAVSELVLPLTVGARIVLVSREVAADGGRLLQLLSQSEVTFVDATPATYRLLLGAGWSGGQHLKCICTGEALPKDLALELVNKVGQLWNGYGPTETTVWSTFWQVRTPVERILIGTPVDNTPIYILDANLQPTPVGVPGELFIGGLGVSLGYFGRPELTRDRFLPDPFAKVSGARMYKTGDVGRYLRGGDIECMGRNDNQVKLRGFRIELGEIEDALGQQAAVKQCAVIVREDRPGDKRLVGYLALKPGAEVKDSDLRAHLKRSLPEYMVPALYVRLESMPLTPSGKINRKALPPPDPAAASSGAEYVAPTTPTETLIAGLWAETLGVPKVSITDDFFALGGHSLLASQILARLRRDHSIDLSFRRIFEAPTVQKFAALIDAGAAAPAQVAVAVTRRSSSGPVPLSVAQERIWLLEEMNPAQEMVHNLPAAWHFKGAVQVPLLERALAEIVARHETTRTVLTMVEGRPHQTVRTDMQLPLQVIDFRGKTEAELLARLAEVTKEKFDLTNGPLLKWSLYQLGAQSFVFYTLRHSLIWDGWSFDIFLREVTTLYAAYESGQPSPLKSLPIAYGDYVQWQRDYLKSPAMEKQKTFWRNQLSGELPELSLPTDRPRLALTAHGGGYTTYKFTRADAEAFTNLGRSSGGTLFMTLFAAYCVVLSRYSGQSELLVGSPVRARGRPELEDLIGAFINAVVLRAKLKPDMTFAQLIEHVRDMMLDSFSHEDMPLELLGARPPVVRALFSLQDARQRPPSLGSIPVEQKHVELSAASNDMMVWMMDQRLSLIAVVNFSTELFDKETVDRFLRGYAAVLHAAVKQPSTPLYQLPVGSPDDLAHSVKLGAPAGEMGPTLGSLLLTRWAQSEAPALVAGAVSLSGRSLLARAQGVAARLAATPGLVALCAIDPVERAVAVLGALLAGQPFVFLDASGASARTQRWCELLRPAVLAQGTGVTGPTGMAQTLALGSVGEVDFVAPAVAADAAAWVVPSFDTAGKPQVLVCSQAALTAQVRSVAARLGLVAGQTVVGHSLPQADLSLFELLVPLVAGAQAHVAGAERLKPASTAFVPAAALAKALPDELKAVEQVVVVGGMAAEHSGVHARMWRLERPAPESLAVVLGPTSPTTLPTKVGLPMYPDRVVIRGSDGRACPVGVPGQLCVGTALPVADTRWSAPSTDAEGLVATSVRARLLNDGSLDVTPTLGVAQVSGQRFFVSEVVAAFVAHPAVDAAHVMPSGGKLVAYLQLKANAAFNETELRKQLKAALPEAFVPSSFEEVESLPRTPQGAVDEAALVARFAERTRAVVPPKTLSQKLIGQLWAEALGLKQVSLYDNFFTLGGYSLLCFKFIAALEEKTSVRLGPRVVLQGSLEQVAAALDAASPARVASSSTATNSAAPVPPPKEEGGLLGRLKSLVKGR
jgi:amino acid adenylation domain-containing protein